MSVSNLTPDEAKVWAMFSKDEPGAAALHPEPGVAHRESIVNGLRSLELRRWIVPVWRQTGSYYYMSALGYVEGPPCGDEEARPRSSDGRPYSRFACAHCGDEPERDDLLLGECPTCDAREADDD